MADYHVNHNGWGVLAYTQSSPKTLTLGGWFTDPGAHVQHVGDLLTWRAEPLIRTPDGYTLRFQAYLRRGTASPQRPNSSDQSFYELPACAQRPTPLFELLLPGYVPQRRPRPIPIAPVAAPIIPGVVRLLAGGSLP